jgi:hypothetical protein
MKIRIRILIPVKEDLLEAGAIMAIEEGMATGAEEARSSLAGVLLAIKLGTSPLGVPKKKRAVDRQRED